MNWITKIWLNEKAHNNMICFFCFLAIMNKFQCLLEYFIDLKIEYDILSILEYGNNYYIHLSCSLPLTTATKSWLNLPSSLVLENHFPALNVVKSPVSMFLKVTWEENCMIYKMCELKYNARVKQKCTYQSFIIFFNVIVAKEFRSFNTYWKDPWARE